MKRALADGEKDGFQTFKLSRSSNSLQSKMKSCTFCQEKKVKCDLLVDSSKCQQCLKRRLDCSLEPRIINEEIPIPITSTNYIEQLDSMDWIKFIDEQLSNENFLFESLRINHSPGLRNAVTEADNDTLNSLDSRGSDSSYMYYGYMGEYDPWLRYYYYKYDENDECFFSKKYFKRLGNEDNPAIFSYRDKSTILKRVKEMDTNVLNKETPNKLSAQIPNFTILYLRFIFNHLPIFGGDFLSEIFSNQGQNINIDPLLVILMARLVKRWDSFDTSISTFIEEEESILQNRKEFFTTTWNLLVNHLHSPDLSSVKSLILFIHMLGFKKDSQSNPFENCVVSSLVSVSYSLGLHMDCTSWKIPNDEKRLRTRLWWIVYVMDKWTSFSTGRPSSIHEDDYNIDHNLSDDLFEDVKAYSSNGMGAFRDIVNLTFILSKIEKNLFSIKATGLSEDAFLDKCTNLKVDLEYWFSTVSVKSCPPSIIMSYFCLNIMIFRARLKVLKPAKFHLIYFDQAKLLLAEILKFLSTLTSSSINSFWYTWSRSLFMYLKDFTLLLIVSSRTRDQSLEVLNLMKSLREWLELNAKSLEILWTTLLRLNIATESIGNQFKESLKNS